LAKLKEKQSFNEQVPHKASFHHKGNKVLCVLEAEDFAALVESK
jgi:hypothetical protein